jgi:hypothetical protein
MQNSQIVSDLWDTYDRTPHAETCTFNVAKPWRTSMKLCFPFNRAAFNGTGRNRSIRGGAL